MKRGGAAVVLADGDRLRVGSVIFQFVRWGHRGGLV